MIDDPEVERYFRHAEQDMFPKMKGSAVSITLLGKPDAKLCLELGAAILFDKPIVVVAPNGISIPANLKRVAAVIIEGNPRDPAFSTLLGSAISGVLKNDRRAAAPCLESIRGET